MKQIRQFFRVLFLTKLTVLLFLGLFWSVLELTDTRTSKQKEFDSRFQEEFPRLPPCPRVTAS